MFEEQLDRRRQVAQAEQFRKLHHASEVLLLPNAWDAGSAALFASMGFPAIATTSGGMAWSLGYPDGEEIPLEEILAAIQRMVRATSLPITVDYEGGYGDSSTEVRVNVAALIDTGAVGLNLEDGVRHQRVRPLEEAAERIAAARQAAESSAVPVVINARIDLWLLGEGGTRQLLEDAIHRAEAYLDAGADCLYPIGLTDPVVLADFIAAVQAPVNVAARPGLINLAELQRLGVSRITTATRLVTLAYAAVREATLAIQQHGSFDPLTSSLSYEAMQSLFPRWR